MPENANTPPVQPVQPPPLVVPSIPTPVDPKTTVDLRKILEGDERRKKT